MQGLPPKRKKIIRKIDPKEMFTSASQMKLMRKKKYTERETIESDRK